MANFENDNDALATVVRELKHLPGIGEKTATRLAHFIIREPEHYAVSLSEAILSVRQKLHTCAICCNFTETPICSICSDSKRDAAIICVVEGPSDVTALERGGHFRGKYHVLHGSLSPLEGMHESKLKIRELQERIDREQVREVILATNPTVEGDTTALYISRLIKEKNLKVSRIAYGIPVGSEIEYQDSATLGKALENRVAL